jgi:HAD superfamily hydrolase (TIGR01509 family)
MNGIDTILFDWDGTLIDTAAYSFTAFQKAFRDLGISIEAELYEKIYAPNWHIMYQALGLPQKQWQKAEDLWLHHYADASVPMVQDGRHTLNELHSRGYCLGIVTSGSQSRVRREIIGFGLSDLFGAVVCNEDVVNKKPHPEGLRAAMKQLNKCPEVCCYVGDSPDDIEMGKQAKVQTIGIISGYPNSKKLPTANPDYCFSSLARLLTHF